MQNMNQKFSAKHASNNMNDDRNFANFSLSCLAACVWQHDHERTVIYIYIYRERERYHYEISRASSSYGLVRRSEHEHHNHRNLPSLFTVVCPWTHAGLHGRCCAAGRWPFCSTTWAFVILFGTWCTCVYIYIDTPPYRQRPYTPVKAARTWNILPPEVTSS